MQAADFLADDRSITALCAELGHRVFDVSNLEHFQSTRGEPGTASMTTMMSSDVAATGSQETLNPHTDSVDASQSSLFSSMSILRNAQIYQSGDDTTIPEDDAQQVTMPMHAGERVCIHVHCSAC